VTIVTFSFETSPNAKPTRKSGGTWHIMSPPSKKWGDTSPVSPTKLRPCLLYTEYFATKIGDTFHTLLHMKCNISTKG